MENRWPPDKVKAVWIPLARKRRAMSRPAWKVFASVPIRRAYGRASAPPARRAAICGSFAEKFDRWAFDERPGLHARARGRGTVEPFKPSINWGHALADSISWVALVWLITAVSVIAVLALLRVVTPWGRQFWLITGSYFSGRHSIRVCMLLA